jgi:hypothetical protein
MPRRVSETPSVAAAASAAVTPGHHLEFDSRRVERVELFLGAAEDHRVAALQPHHHLVRARGSTSARLMKRCSVETLP